jgi:hypothetical protein
MFMMDGKNKGNQLFGLDKLCKKYLKKNMTGVEIGSFAGVSSKLISSYVKRLHCVDLWKGYAEINDSFLVEAEKRFDLMAKNNKKIVKLKMDSIEALMGTADKSLDFGYVDGAHHYEQVFKEITFLQMKVKDGGIIAGHDYNFPDVKKAVDELLDIVETFEDNSWVAYNVPKQFLISFVTIYGESDQHYLENMMKSLPKGQQVCLIKTIPTTEKVSNTVENIRLKGDIVFGDLYYNPRWEGDFQFDKMRNIAQTVARGKWIFHVDSDDRLLPHQHDRMIELLRDIEPDVWAIAVQVINTVLDDKNQYATPVEPQLVIIRNIKSIKWESCVHETCELSILRQGKKFVGSLIKIDHEGYNIDSEAMKRKIIRNIRGLATQELTYTEDHFLQMLIRDTMMLNNLRKY